MRLIDSGPGQGRILAAREGFGSVSRCPAGCYHVRLPHVAFRVSAREYRMLLELLADSAESPSAPSFSSAPERHH